MTLAQELVGSHAPDFELPGIDNEVYHLGRYVKNYKAIAVIFICNQTPQAISYLERLKQIQAQFADQQFTIIGINSRNFSDDLSETFVQMKNFAAVNQLNFPYLRDTTQEVAKSFGAQVIPQAFLLDKDAVIRYTGKIDDCAESAEAVKNHYLKDNIINLLADKEIKTAYTEPVGTPIEWYKR